MTASHFSKVAKSLIAPKLGSVEIDRLHVSAEAATALKPLLKSSHLTNNKLHRLRIADGKAADIVSSGLNHCQLRKLIVVDWEYPSNKASALAKKYVCASLAWIVLTSSMAITWCWFGRQSWKHSSPERVALTKV